MKIEIDTDTISNPDALGELLRNIFFDQSKGKFECYSAFDLNHGVRPLRDEVIEGCVYRCAQWKGIKMRYYWDGNGYMEFNLESSILCNTDCKRSHGWDFIRLDQP